MSPVVWFVLGYLACVFTLLPLWLAWLVIAPWMRGLLTGAFISLPHILGMRARGTPAMLIIDAYASLLHRGVQTTAKEVESAYIVDRHAIANAGELAAKVEQQIAALANCRNPAQP